jgi:hypothetical protein
MTRLTRVVVWKYQVSDINNWYPIVTLEKTEVSKLSSPAFSYTTFAPGFTYKMDLTYEGYNHSNAVSPFTITTASFTIPTISQVTSYDTAYQAFSTTTTSIPSVQDTTASMSGFSSYTTAKYRMEYITLPTTITDTGISNVPWVPLSPASMSGFSSYTVAKYRMEYINGPINTTDFYSLNIASVTGSSVSVSGMSRYVPTVTGGDVIIIGG